MSDAVTNKTVHDSRVVGGYRLRKRGRVTTVELSTHELRELGIEMTRGRSRVHLRPSACAHELSSYEGQRVAERHRCLACGTEILK